MQTTQNIIYNKKIPLVSFIITYYNIPIELVYKCLDSILSLSLSQTEREIIVVDDGSHYCPINDLIKYDNYIKFIRKPHDGISDSRNIGLQMAEGEFIQFIDGDDQLLTTPYEHCLDIIRYKRPDMVIFNFTDIEKKVINISKQDIITNGTEYLHNNNISGSVWHYLFKRTIIGSLRFTTGIDYGEDEEFTPQLLLRAENIIVTDVAAYFYRQHSQSVIHKNDTRSKLKRIDDNLKVILHLKNLASELPYNDCNALQRRIAQLTMDYIYNVILLTKSRKFLDKKLINLHEEGLFPLPNKKYTNKYVWFRKLTNSKLGLSILMRIIPTMGRKLKL